MGALKFSTRTLLVIAGLAFFMLLTRGSHTLTPYNLPDASLAAFLLGGLFLRRAVWFFAFFILATFIDFGAAALDPAQGFCLTNGYWGLIPAYGAMWFGGLWLAKRQDAFDLLPYASASMLGTFIAFVVSTQTYYLFSGRFPNDGPLQTIQYGWNYLPSWMGYAAMYFAAIWLAVALLRSVKPVKTSQI
jgi:hypothetical protein